MDYLALYKIAVFLDPVRNKFMFYYLMAGEMPFPKVCDDESVQARKN